jgi:GT2 family glycosyltransferase
VTNQPPAASAEPSTVAVVIPACDRPELLVEALASVLAQQRRPDQVIVVDNGVTTVPDGLLPAGTAYYRLQPRVGPSRARNFGAAMATTRFIAFLDDDDLWTTSYLREAMAALARHGARCVFGRRDLLSERGPTPYKMATRDTLTVPTLLRRNPGTAPSNMVVERELLLRVGGFDERLFVSEDRAMSIELLLHGAEIALAPEAVALIRDHALGHLSTRHARKFRFLWKYRRLYSLPGFVAEAARIAAKVAAAPLLRALPFTRRMTGRPAAPPTQADRAWPAARAAPSTPARRAGRRGEGA